MGAEIIKDIEIIVGVVRKLAGPIDPVGSTETDAERFENLRVMTGVIEDLLRDVDTVAYDNKDRYEFSMKKAAGLAYKFLTTLEFRINDA